MYREGRGVPQDAAEAFRWFRLAAEQGHASAQVLLGAMYATGRGVPQDEAEAVRWYRLSAEQGHATAQYNLWFMCERGSSRIPCSPTCGSTSVAQTERRLPGDRGTPWNGTGPGPSLCMPLPIYFRV